MHALLDDNGDQLGTERPDAALKDSPQEKSVNRESRDGGLAKQTFLPPSIK
jgi:hypothetical protein